MDARPLRRFAITVLACILCAACWLAALKTGRGAETAPPCREDDSSQAERLALAAMSQIGVTVGYDPSYARLDYPGGDVPLDRGVCSDVVIRAFRALGIDLQVLIHEDMEASFKCYPQLWGLSVPDPNIDHRRVPNIVTYLRRQGKAVPVTDDEADYRPGDIVAWRLPGNRSHIGIVSCRRAWCGRLLIVHNIGAGARLEDALFAFEITGHFRYFES